MEIPHFTRFACFDWSGQAVERPKGIALAICDVKGPPRLVTRVGGWSRQAALDWLREVAGDEADMLIGFDLSPTLPLADEGAYFPGWADSPSDAPALWALVDALCEADPHFAASGLLSHPEARRHFRQLGDCGDLFPAGRGRWRLCEYGQKDMGVSPVSCFNLVGAAQVGKSSLTGMRVFNRLRGVLPLWPIDPLPQSGPVMVEIYTSLAARAAGLPRGRSKIRDAVALDAALAALGSPSHIPIPRYDDHSTDALLTAAWLRKVANDPTLWNPSGLTPEIARTEGWTFGVL